MENKENRKPKKPKGRFLRTETIVLRVSKEHKELYKYLNSEPGQLKGESASSFFERMLESAAIMTSRDFKKLQKLYPWVYDA